MTDKKVEPKNLLTELKEEVAALKILLGHYGEEKEHNDSKKFLALCLQEAHFAIRDLDYRKIKNSLEALRTFEQ